MVVSCYAGNETYKMNMMSRLNEICIRFSRLICFNLGKGIIMLKLIRRLK